MGQRKHVDVQRVPKRRSVSSLAELSSNVCAGMQQLGFFLACMLGGGGWATPPGVKSYLSLSSLSAHAVNSRPGRGGIKDGETKRERERETNRE